MPKVLLVLNDPPYGTERSFNGLRLAKALAGKGTHVTVFLMADAVACAKSGQKVPQGYYNLDPGMVELHATPPPLGPAEDGDCKSPIPGWSSCTRPCRPSGRRKTTTASRRSRDGRVARDPAAPRADGRRRLQVADPGMVELHATLPPSGRRKTATASRRSRDGRVARDPAAPRAGGRRRLQVADPGAVPGNVELHSTPAPRPGGRRRLQVADPGGAAWVRYGLSSPIARRSSRECRVALDLAGRQAGGGRRLQVVDPGSRPGMSDSATRAGLALACHLK
jgi:hypothetical protein